MGAIDSPFKWGTVWHTEAGLKFTEITSFDSNGDSHSIYQLGSHNFSERELRRNFCSSVIESSSISGCTACREGTTGKCTAILMFGPKNHHIQPEA